MRSMVPCTNKSAVIVFGLPMVFVLFFMVAPYAYIFRFSLASTSGYDIVYSTTYENFARILREPLYFDVLVHSFKTGLIVTLVALPLGFLLAYYLCFIAKSTRVFYFLIVAPLLTSFVLRVYMWKLILGRTGVINGALSHLGLIDEPLSFLLYSRLAVYVTLTYIYVPFMFLPIYTALEKLNATYVEASFDLGASTLVTLRKVVIPLCMPGIVAGAVFTFCLSSGDFVVSALVGGPKGVMVSNVIIEQFGGAFNWPFGSALAAVVLSVVLVIITAGSVAERHKAEDVAG